MYTVYTYHGADDAVLYVGYTANVERRNAQHCLQSRWFGEAVHMTTEHFATQGDALRHERETIMRLQPTHNFHHTERAHKPRHLRKETASYTLPKRLIRAINHYATDQGLSKSAAVIALFDIGMKSVEEERRAA